VLAAVLVTTAGCSHSDRSPLAGALLRDPGAGLSLVKGATGSMDVDLASRSTAAPSGVVRDYLGQSGYQEGYSKVWRHDDEIVTALVFEFFSPRNADGFVTLIADSLAGSSAERAFSDADVPGSRGYILTSYLRGGVSFCVGELFSVGDRAYSLTRCTGAPQSTERVKRLAAQQHELAVRAVPTPGASS
jgi:hypothetical protein